MTRAAPKDMVQVSIVEQNPLGLEFVLTFLRKDSSIQVLPIQDLPSRGNKGAAAPVIVVDNCALPLPLSECLRRLRFHSPDAKCLVIDHELSRQDLLRLLWLKVDGFLPYAEVSRSLVPAVHSVAEGNIWIPREILREYVQRAQELRRKDASSLERMTSRENQIIELVKRRLSNKEIADILRIREGTVKFHLSNVYSKLQVGSRHDLICDNAPSSVMGMLPRALRPGGSKA